MGRGTSCSDKAGKDTLGEEADRRAREGIPFSEKAWEKVATVLQELDLDADFPPS